jgi:hypothetical protein
MKNLLFFLCLSYSSSFFGQCPSAGADTNIYVCKSEMFDISLFISNDADTSGVFFDPIGQPLNTTTFSLPIPGYYVYDYVVSADSCDNDTAQVIIHVEYCGSGGINENYIQETNLASPNPVEDILTVKDNQFDNLQLFNSLGQVVFECDMLLSNEMDLSTFKQGLYLLRIERENNVYYQRIIKE